MVFTSPPGQMASVVWLEPGIPNCRASTSAACSCFCDIARLSCLGRTGSRTAGYLLLRHIVTSGSISDRFTERLYSGRIRTAKPYSLFPRRCRVRRKKTNVSARVIGSEQCLIYINDVLRNVVHCFLPFCFDRTPCRL